MRIEGLQLTADDSGLDWRPTEVPGVAWCPLCLEGDREGGDAVVLIRMEAGAGYPAHRHRGPEDVLILRGGYRDERGEHRAPCHLRYEAGSVHAPVALEGEACLLYAVARDGVELVG